jgi:hypothetical protein
VLDADVEEHTFELFVIDPKAKREKTFLVPYFNVIAEEMFE